MRKYLLLVMFVGLIGPVAYLFAQSGTAIPQPKPVRVLSSELAQAPENQAVVEVGSSPAADAAKAKIEAALASPTEFEFKDVPLNEVINLLKVKHKIEIQLDAAGLKDASVDADVKVTKKLSGISLGAALHNLLDELGLAYVIHDEVLLVTSTAKADSDEFMTTRIYPVKDLVLVRNEQGAIVVEFEPLQDVITQTVATKTWQENGGNGTITAYQTGDRCLLVVSATQDVHEQVAGLLAALRKAGGKPVGELPLHVRPK